MSETATIQVTVNGKTYDYPAGTTYGAIASDFRDAVPYPILAVNAGERERELQKKADRDAALTFLTAANPQGARIYEHSLTLLFLSAFYATIGKDKIDRVTVEFSLSNALFITAEGDFTLTDSLLKSVEKAMRKMVEQDTPITRTLLSMRDARALFETQKMNSKASLLRYRMSSKIPVYTLGGFSDYFYSHMVPSCGCLSVFGLQKFEDGLVLRLPDKNDPSQLGAFTPSMKVYHEMYETTLLQRKLGIDSVAKLNKLVSTGRTQEIVLASEALMEKKIGDLAQDIASRKGVRFVMIAGPSSSGKTTFSNRLSTQLSCCGLHPHPIATDNYFVNRDRTPLNEKGEPNFECLEAMDVKQFNEDMTRLLKGETVEIPQYNFKKGMREYVGDYLTLGENDVLVIEGIHCLNDAFSYALPAESKYRVYISCLTTLNLDDHNRIHTTDTRLLRRIERDARTRGYSAASTIHMWPSVRAGEEGNIFPYQDSADRVFNSALIYELSLLRSYIEPVLYDIEPDSPEFIESRRLLQFLSWFMMVPDDLVPITSLAREFVGGGCFKV